MGSLLSALHFLTTIPLLPTRSFSVKEFGRSVGFFPLVGFIIGLILVGFDYLLGFVFPETVISGLIIAGWLALTGALHFDGLLDTFDGLFGGYDENSRLEIMKDERVGAFGFAAGVILLLVKFASLDAINGQQRIVALLLAPTIGRWGLSVIIYAFPYARKEGLGRGIKDFITMRQVALATGTALLVAFITSQWIGVLIMGISILTIWFCARFALHKIPGLTGDIYGAICEITEVAVLLMMAVKV